MPSDGSMGSSGTPPSQARACGPSFQWKRRIFCPRLARMSPAIRRLVLSALLLASGLTACFETNLALSAGQLDQVFQMRAASYTSTQAYVVSSIRVIPTAESTAATIKVNDVVVASGTPSQPIDLAVGSDNVITVQVTAENGVTTRSYGITVTRQMLPAFSQEALLQASNPAALQRFGYSVSISGDTLAVGAPLEASAATGIDGDQSDLSAPEAGAVYVFVRDGAGTWTQQAYIKASNAAAGHRFGWSVSLSGDTLAVGAPLENGAASGINGDESDQTATRSGAVYVFMRNGGTWTQQAYVKASDTGVPDDHHAEDRFGWSVAVSGDTLAAGAPFESSDAGGIDGAQGNNFSSLSGAVYVFTRVGAAWSQQSFIKASTNGAGDQFGYTVAVDGDTLAVAAPFEDSGATGVGGSQTDKSALNSGAVYVFTRNSGVWAQQAYVKASDTHASDQFGLSLAIDADTLAVGAPYQDSAAGDDPDDAYTTYDSGAVYVFIRATGTWSEQARIKATAVHAGDHFGWSTALAGDTLLVGAPLEDSSATGLVGDPTDTRARDSGAAYLFTRGNGAWTQDAYLKPSNTFTFAWFGYGVGLSGANIAVSSPQEGSTASTLDHYDATADALDGPGAVYLFR